MSDMPTSTFITISNPTNLPLIDYRTVRPLQGNLKDLSESNYQKLKNILVNRGFRVPLFLWEGYIPGDGAKSTYFLLDGHQRVRVMLAENMQPYEVPFVLIEAKDEAQAKAQLLEITSQYGRITQEGLDEFSVGLPEAELMDLSFDALPEFSEAQTSQGGQQNNDSELQCPECGHVNSPNAFKKIPSGELSNA